MGYLFAAAFPILPGQTERVKNWGKEIEPFMEEYERLNNDTTFTRYNIYVQETPMGDLAIHAFEVDDPSKIRQSFTDSPYDTWYLNFVRDVHGFDLLESNPGPPPQVFEWKKN